MNPKWKRPADAASSASLRDIERLSSAHSHTANADLSQAPDDSGESDFAYFAARPEARTRIRLPFDGEFPAVVVELARGRTMFVHVVIERDPATGEPGTRGRAVFFTDIGGGRA
jgi:hypothetical protein